MENLKSLSPNIYNYEDIKTDETKFEFDDGHLACTIDGTLLWIDVEDYNINSAKITGVSWFGNLGAVFIEYKSTFRFGKWHLKMIGYAIS